ncbi:MAG: hydrogenase maturation protease [Acidimicrobiales bacterium]
MTTVIAGIGNIFNRDDGFGSEVAQRLLSRPVPADVRVEDYGIRGMHLALDLLEGCDLLVLIDAMSLDGEAGGDAPGTVFLLEPDPSGDGADALDAHLLDPQAVLRMVAGLGGEVGRVLVVGCQPADLDEGIGLSPPVTAAVAVAVRMVEDLIAERNAPCSVA